jgi:GNAT superfamily N-acetyltransferase
MQDHFLNHAKNLPIKVREEIAQARTVKYIQTIARERTIAVADAKNKVVGMGALKENEVRHMYVLLKYQRKGIGSKILDFLEKKALENKSSFLIVNSVAHSEKFYVKNGFKAVKKTMIVRHGQPLEAVLLEKRLE